MKAIKNAVTGKRVPIPLYIGCLSYVDALTQGYSRSSVPFKAHEVEGKLGSQEDKYLPLPHPPLSLG